ncbi:MAG: alpha/beta hydrolase [Burkholderiales bacterium]|nr:MAG: alpha/beta hydrolase [Burkholderiales bacterium]
MTPDLPIDDDAMRPGWLRLALEGRVPLEAAALVAALPLLAASPRGDGHPVLVFPGLAASDASTRPLRRLLRGLGHDAHGWQLGRNLGPRPEILEGAAHRIRTLAERDGRRVSLVGWSLGGIYARELAKQLPDAVRAVVTLGTPFAGSPRATNAWRLFELLNGRQHREPRLREGLRTPPPVPTTSIWSRSDGIVAWQCSVERPGPRAENIVVAASHIGLGLNPLALHALADRLAQPEGGWRPFERRGLRRWLFADPARAAARGLPEATHATGAAR